MRTYSVYNEMHIEGDTNDIVNLWRQTILGNQKARSTFLNEIMPVRTLELSIDASRAIPLLSTLERMAV